ncbi:MAG: hypothetical protein ACLTDF_04165 [Coprococcus sp.]
MVGRFLEGKNAGNINEESHGFLSRTVPFMIGSSLLLGSSDWALGGSSEAIMGFVPSLKL